MKRQVPDWAICKSHYLTKDLYPEHRRNSQNAIFKNRQKTETDTSPKRYMDE